MMLFCAFGMLFGIQPQSKGKLVCAPRYLFRYFFGWGIINIQGCEPFMECFVVKKGGDISYNRVMHWFMIYGSRVIYRNITIKYGIHWCGNTFKYVLLLAGSVDFIEQEIPFINQNTNSKLIFDTFVQDKLACVLIKYGCTNEIMMNDDNLESNLPTSSLLKMCCLVQVLVQVELCFYCPVAGDELTVCVLHNLTLQVNLFSVKIIYWPPQFTWKYNGMFINGHKSRCGRLRV